MLIKGLGNSVGRNDLCVDAFQKLKLGKKVKYIIYKLDNDNKNIEVAKTSEDGDYDNFLAEFPENDCRYAVYDFEYSLASGEGKRYDEGIGASSNSSPGILLQSLGRYTMGTHANTFSVGLRSASTRGRPTMLP